MFIYCLFSFEYSPPPPPRVPISTVLNGKKTRKELSISGNRKTTFQEQGNLVISDHPVLVVLNTCIFPTDWSKQNHNIQGRNNLSVEGSDVALVGVGTRERSLIRQ